MIDAPGPWGTGPFTLTEGYSSMLTRIAMIRREPFACTWLIEGEDRSDRVVLEANRNHWNSERGPRLERVIFRNDLSPQEALDACIGGEGEMDIVTEVSPADAQRVIDSEHADLQVNDANRVLVMIINRLPADAPLSDTRARQALNLAVDKVKIIDQALLGYANPLVALTPAWCSGYPAEAQAYPHDPDRARQLMDEAGWPQGRSLRIATPAPFAGIAQMVADDITAALGVDCDLIVVPDEDLLAGARILIEKKVEPPWDLLLHGWFDLSSEAPPAFVHRAFFAADGEFRAGPELEQFDKLMGEMAVELDPGRLVEIAEQIDTYVFDEALALFLCAPQALYAVNKHVRFDPYRTTFELAETEVDEQHWSRRRDGQTARTSGARVDFAGGSAGNAC